ncbi:MAG: orotidine-5'-phosphate decarboxylase [Deltaproteobacteria bacterium]|nr:orotidine-5'-phosphate decarboxylase [Deltaproteobacteria bacterium]
MTTHLSPKDRIIFPLDVPNLKEARRFVRLLKKDIDVFKIGLELFVSEGPDIIRMVKKEGGAKIFLDMKFHDIPETVRRAYAAASRHGVDFVTVHCDDTSLLKSAANGSSQKTKVLGVTVLTSLSGKNLKEMGLRKELQNPLKLVLHRAELAKKAGCSGVVCSGLEVRYVKKALGRDFITVCPGIRPVWGDVKKDDQKRFVTPYEAVKNGADYIVVGRPVRDAINPVLAAKMVADEIGTGLDFVNQCSK